MTEDQERIEGLQRRAMLEHHLLYNHIPAIPLDFIDTAEAAITAYEEGDAARKITMPNGIVKEAHEIIDGMHLDGFLPEPEDGIIPPQAA